jgi:hypothetical protein
MRSSELVSGVSLSVFSGRVAMATGPVPRHRCVRRGSALVVVIGTLALISVFAAIYISIGRADTRAVATQQSRTTQGGYSDRYAEHVTRVIASDRLDATMQYADALRRYQVPRRETADAPYTDWSMRSQSDDPADWFFPAGGNPFTRANGDNFDPRVPSDPWLASLRPQYLGELGVPDVTPFSSDRASDSFALEGYLDNRDWLQISNFAPDGRFVNLFNLRPNPSGGPGDIGGFNAEPGWGTTTFPDGTRVRRMSEGLSLYDQRNPGDPESAIQSFSPIDNGGRVWVPGQSAPVSLGLSPADVQNTPAIWSMYQRFALIPLDQPFVTYNRNGQVSSWADPDYPAYQWADANGDGFADSRWFELTEARDALTGNQPREDVQRLYDAGEFRVFAAIRAVDLSGMVNVNTARDSLTPPTGEFPLGLTPSEVDLRRLMTMQDQAENYDGDRNVSNRDELLSFSSLRAPALENGVAQNAARRPASDYSRYRQRLLASQFRLDPGIPGENQFPVAPNPAQVEFSNGMLIGRYAASAIHESVVRNVTLPPIARGPLSLSSIALPADLLLTEGSPLQRPMGSATDFSGLGEQRKEFYDSVGKINPLRLDEAGVRSLEGRSIATEGQYFGMGLFGIDDLAELLTFHGLNDDEVTSRLEAAAQGRLQFEGGTGEERYSPLLSTRPLSLDRDFHGQIAISATNPNRGSEVTGEIARESMALMALSPRKNMTTVSGATALRPSSVAGIAGRGGSELSPSALSFEDDGAVSVSDLTDVQAAFRVYYRALAGELEVFRLKRASGVDGLPAGITNAVWDTDLSQVRDNPYSTLFYGHRGPELAMRIAAHAAVNSKDLFDTNTEPTVLTLLLDNSTVTNTLIESVTQNGNYGTDRFDVAASPVALLYPGLSVQPQAQGGSAPNLIDLDAGVTDRAREVLPRDRLPEPRRLVNVFGVEPTPILTEVVSVYVYTDASTVNGGDVDSGDEPPRPTRPGLRPIIRPEDIVPVTVDGTVSEGNTDLMMQVLAIQLTNPWDEDIRIGGGEGEFMYRKGDAATDRFNPNNNLIFDYYIEYAGRFFKLGDFIEYTEADIDFSSDGGPFIASGNSITPDAAQTNAEVQYRGVTIPAGESRVFFAVSHARFDSVPEMGPDGGLDQRWTDALTESGGLPEQFTDLGRFDPDGDGIANGGDGRSLTGPAREWIDAQLRSTRGAGTQPAPYRIHPFDPKTGELVFGINTVDVGSIPTASNFQDLMSAPLGFGSDAVLGQPGRTADLDVVRLWRKFTVPGVEEVTQSEITSGSAATLRTNLVQNDILVDRIDTSGGLNVAMPGGDQPIANSVGFPEEFSPVLDPCSVTDTRVVNLRNDNLGLTFVRYASVSRKDTMRELTQADEASPERNIGKIDAYLISSWRDPASTTIRRTNTSLLQDSLDAGNLFEFCGPDFTDPFNGVVRALGGMQTAVAYDADRTVREFFESGWPGRSERKQVRTIATHPRYKNSDVPPPPGGGTPVEGDPENGRFDADGLETRATLANARELFGDPTNPQLLPEVFLSPRLDAARVTDALLAMGIGPTYAPDPLRNPTNNYEVVDEEWITLTEAFGIALGFEDFATANPATDVTPDIVWYDAVRSYVDPFTGANEVEYVLDDLRLRIDDYVAFLNLERAGEVGPNQKPSLTFDPATPTASDARRGTGAPIALGVLDGLRAIDPIQYPNDPADAGRRALTSPIMGLVNINTAPVDVLRLLPGLSPSAAEYRTRSDEDAGNYNLIKPEAWAATGGLAAGSTPDELGLGGAMYMVFEGADPVTGPLNNPDIAAGLVAYRDRVFAQPRTRSDPRFFPIAASGLSPLSYAFEPALPGANESFIDNRYGEVDNARFRTRSAISGVDGLRGTPGFGSLGEMLMASIPTDLSLPMPPNPTGDLRQDLVFYRQLSMQQYGSDTRNLGVVGMGNDAVTLSPNYTRSGGISDDGNRAGSTPDDYVEKLAAAAGVMNMTTTRSDFFAVWMVLQGFRESDVAGLRPEDALVPSFKRRYLMVIDRSNVIEPGDAPRVVLMREVPL